MTQRERSLLMVLLVVGGFVLLGGGLVFGHNLSSGLALKDKQIETLQSEMNTQKRKLAALNQARRRLDHWKAISLAPDVSAAGSRYRLFLQDLCRRHGLRTLQEIRQVNDSSSLRATAGRGPLYTPLSYGFKVEGSLSRLMEFLAEFYAVNYPHQIRHMMIATRLTGSDLRMEIDFKVEVLAMPNIPARDYLPAAPNPQVLCLETIAALGHGPAGLALAASSVSPTGLYGARKLAGTSPGSRRNYADPVAAKTFNIFAGKTLTPAITADRDVLKFVVLTDIYETFVFLEAHLYNKRTGHDMRIRAEAGHDTFEVRDTSDRVVLKGKIKAIDYSRLDVFFIVDDKHYMIHIGEDLHQAMRKELTEEERKLAEAKQATTAENIKKENP